MTALHLGCGRHHLDGFVNIDLIGEPGVDVACNLDQPNAEHLANELAANLTNFGCDLIADPINKILGIHFLEHIEHQLPLMEALHMISGAECEAHFVVPYGSSDDAFSDPTHVRRMFIESWSYFGQPNYHRADYGYRGDWRTQNIDLQLWPDAYDRGEAQWLELAMRYRNVVREMSVTMVKVDPIRPQEPVAGELDVSVSCYPGDRPW